jgi:hypothetical protein
MVSLELPGAVTALGLKLAVAPVGSPAAERLTVPANPPVAETLTVQLVEPPRSTVLEDGLTARPKSAGGLTTSTTWAEWTSDPLVPVTVSG